MANLPAPPDSVKPAGWFRAVRTAEAMELLSVNKNALVLAYVIAYRAQFSDRFNRHHLALGEAFLGDFESYGMTEREYRTAKSHLESWGFATFKATNQGTIGKLADARLFAVFRLASDGQKGRRETDRRRTGDGQATTTKNRKTTQEPERTGEMLAPGNATQPLTGSERVSLEAEIKRVEARLQAIYDGASEDAFGPKYSRDEREERQRLNARRKEIKDRLGWIA